MNRSKFALSWGRNIFFGLGWALISVVALNYLQGVALPHSFIDWALFTLSFIGHYGLLTALIYFVFFVPLITLMPNYYFSKFWSTFLIIVTATFVLIDSHIFNEYGLHFNQSVIQHIVKSGPEFVLSLSKPFIIVASSFILISFFSLWFRGEKIWRTMKSRFSNPVKNWYLVLIVLCFGASQLIPKILENKGFKTAYVNSAFPLIRVFEKRESLAKRPIYYPKKPLVCKGDNNKNLIVVSVKDLTNEKLLVEDSFFSHLLKHSTLFKNHISIGETASDKMFSLFYSLPPAYSHSLEGTNPVLIEEMLKRKYQVGMFSEKLPGIALPNHIASVGNSPVEVDLRTFENWKKWMFENDEELLGRPFFTFIDLTSGTENSSIILSDLLKDLYRLDLMQNTVLIITGVTSEKTSPLIVINGKKAGVREYQTSSYDIAPSLMKDFWNCKNPVNDYGYGKNIWESGQEFSLVAGTSNLLRVIDFKNKVITSINNNKKITSINFLEEEVPLTKELEEVFFLKLKDVNSFYKKAR